MATLPARDRELLALRYGADLTAAQLAELLGMQTNAAEVALHRALARLRTMIDPAGAAPQVDLAAERRTDAAGSSPASA
jgi:DNA-directed RNA polymerase specialized sigma24 family protein